MARSRALRNMVALGVAALMVVGGSAVAFADQITVDGDGLSPVAGNTAVVSACTDEAVEFTVLIAARRNGSPTAAGGDNNVFANNSNVTIDFSSATAGMSATLVDKSIALGQYWRLTAGGQSTQNALSSETLAAVVNLPAQAAGGSGTVVFSFSGLNAVGNPVTGTGSVAVTWATPVVCSPDGAPPTLVLPGTITEEATSASGAAVEFSVAAEDAIDPDPTVTCTWTSGAVFPIGTTTVSCTAEDASGNKTTGSFAVVVEDTVAPEVGAMTGITFEAEGPATVITWIDPVASDATAGSPAVACTPASGTAFAVGTHEIVCSASDAYGNTGTSSFTVTITDKTAPILVVPADFEREATGPGGAVVAFDAMWLDLVDGSGAAACSPESGFEFPLGPTLVTCSVTDAGGNTAAESFTVEIVDTTAPDLTVPGPIVAEATSGAGATVEYPTSANDIVSGSVAVVCDVPSGSIFSLAVTTVTCTAKDGTGNTATKTFTVRVHDTTAPELTVPGTMNVEATGPNGASVVYAATATDAVSDVTPVCEPASGTTLAIGNYQVNCSATDAAGNSTSKAFAVYVEDTTPPVLDLPDDFSIEATGPSGAVATWEATAEDVVDGDRTVTCSPVSGSTFALDDTLVTCTSADTRGNASEGSFTVTVTDTTPPVITWVTPTEGASYVWGSVPAGSCTASDLVSGAVPCTVEPLATSIGSHTANASATDGRGNTATAERAYTVAAWRLSGFYQPVDMGVNTWNTVKGGSTVPLKFEVFAGSTEMMGTSAIRDFVVKGVACPGTGVVTDDIELLTTGGTTLRYDSTAGQFIQNWQTPKKAGACYTVTMTTQDGSSITANFKLK